MCEGKYTPEQPQTPLYDDFNRADENPLDGGLWNTSATDIPTFNNRGELVSNQAKRGGSWSLFVHSPRRCAEVWASFPVLGSLGWGLVLHGSGSGFNGNRLGYEFAGLPVQGKSDMDRYEFGNASFQAGVEANQIIWLDPAANHRLLLRRHRKLTSGYIYFGGQWEWVCSRYYTGTGINSPISGEVGFEIFDTTGRMDDFGQGEYPCPIFVPQIYRHTQGQT